MEIKEKIKDILKFYNLRQNSFADRIGVTPQTVSDVLNDKKKAGDKIIIGILDNFQDINPLWLFRDEEEMHASKNEKKNLSDFSNEEIALHVINRESEFLNIPIFSNLIEKKAAMKAIEILNNV
ncbi:helix-turn-helix domain-containing protein [Kordia sp.]|uniref:helix-turn-helix domain-containing protein n=1 Tax=Kordia sp. TaxID=1965332 RepID=UPI003D6C5512